MERDKEKRCCGNCKYFEQHYSWNGNSFCAVNCGHCAHVLRAKNRKLSFGYFSVCRLWEDGANERKSRNESIVRAVKEMCDRIDEIAEVLEEDDGL